MARVFGASAGAMTASQRGRYATGLRQIMAHKLADATAAVPQSTIAIAGRGRSFSGGQTAMPIVAVNTRLPSSLTKGAIILTQGADGLFRVVDIKFGGASLVAAEKDNLTGIISAAGGDMELVVDVTKETARDIGILGN